MTVLYVLLALFVFVKDNNQRQGNPHCTDTAFVFWRGFSVLFEFLCD